MAAFYVFFLPLFGSVNTESLGTNVTVPALPVLCPYFKNGPSLEVKELVGSWMTVYTQPRAVNCFTLHIRATTELEREQNLLRLGNFSGRVHWDDCLLEMESPLGKHYLQGNGSDAGLLENIILTELRGEYKLDDQSGDQWTMFGRRGSELLLMRDCTGEAAAVFARAPYWPSATDLYAVLHRSGITPMTRERVLCDPIEPPIQQCSLSSYFSKRRF